MTDKKIKILVVEDEKKLAQSIERQLVRVGYEVNIAYNGFEAEELVRNHVYDIITLDINLPKKLGTEFLQALRQNMDKTPVIILSARDKIQDRITGLLIGADDYVTKPFDVGELLARIEAVLRRSGTSKATFLKVDDLRMDLVNHEVKRGEKVLNLTQREYTLLEFFLRNKNQILTRKRIAEQVWGYTFDSGTNIVDVYVSYLRKVVDEGFEKKLIRTEYGEGFILRDE